MEKEHRLVSERVRNVFLDMEEERKERRESLEALRRDVDLVVRPMLPGDGVEVSEGGSLVTALAKTCLDWQQEMAVMRDRLGVAERATAAAETNVKNMLLVHERQLSDYVASHAAVVQQYYEDFQSAGSVVSNWVLRRRSKEELRIEAAFLGGEGGAEELKGLGPGGQEGGGLFPAKRTVSIHEALRDLLSELQRSHTAAEARASGEVMALNELLERTARGLAARCEALERSFAQLRQGAQGGSPGVPLLLPGAIPE